MREFDITMQVAVCLAAGLPRTQIAAMVGCDDAEVKMAAIRIKRATDGW